MSVEGGRITSAPKDMPLLVGPKYFPSQYLELVYLFCEENSFVSDNSPISQLEQYHQETTHASHKRCKELRLAQCIIEILRFKGGGRISL